MVCAGTERQDRRHGICEKTRSFKAVLAWTIGRLLFQKLRNCFFFFVKVKSVVRRLPSQKQTLSKRKSKKKLEGNELV